MIAAGKWPPTEAGISLSRSIPQAERMPRWYLPAVGMCGGLYVTWAVLITHGDAIARAIVGVLVAVLAVALVLACRRTYWQALARPLPQHGLLRWLATLPGWLMTLAYPAAVLALAVVAAVAIALAHMPAAGFVPAVGPLLVLTALGQALAWQELRRRPSTHPG
jgi:hypothetical protein